MLPERQQLASILIPCQVHIHVCSELLNAVCENDARRARALLAVLPEAAHARAFGRHFTHSFARWDFSIACRGSTYDDLHACFCSKHCDWEYR